MRSNARLQCYLYVPIEADGRVEDGIDRKSVVRRSAAGTLPLAVDVEGQRATVEVQLDADDTSGSDAALGALSVTARVHEPAARAVNVHAPATLILTCVQHQFTEPVQLST